MKRLLAILALALASALPAEAAITFTNPNVDVYTSSMEAQVTPVVQAATYTNGNEVGPVLVFANILRPNVFSGILETVTVTVKSPQTAGLELYFFSANPAGETWTDKVTPATTLSVTDAQNFLGPVPLGPPDTGLGGNTVYSAKNIGQVIYAINGGATNLYAVLVTTGALAPTSTSNIVVSAFVLQD